jgi:hypothetical protein
MALNFKIADSEQDFGYGRKVDVWLENDQGWSVAGVRIEIFEGKIQAFIWNDMTNDEPVKAVISLEQADAYDGEEDYEGEWRP